MRTVVRWLRLALSGILLCIFIFIAGNYQTCIYLIRQAAGQLEVLTHTIPVKEYQTRFYLKSNERSNLQLIEKIRNFSVNELGYKFTSNFMRIYPQKDTTLLWVISASGKYDLEPYEWDFPLVGKVSYKGFFDKDLAVKEFNTLVFKGYDAEIRAVTAWSTLGWFSDPLLSGMLRRSKGGFCDLLLHELFHATLYLKGSVDLNENLASFIARKGTEQFLMNDPVELRSYRNKYRERTIYANFIKRQKKILEEEYHKISNSAQKLVLKLKLIQSVCDSIPLLRGSDSTKNIYRRKELQKFKNAYFVGFTQYDSMQDSLEEVFNKIYRGDLKKLVRDLTLR